MGALADLALAAGALEPDAPADIPPIGGVKATQLRADRHRCAYRRNPRRCTAFSSLDCRGAMPRAFRQRLSDPAGGKPPFQLPRLAAYAKHRGSSAGEQVVFARLSTVSAGHPVTKVESLRRTIAGNVRCERERQGLTQRQLAAAAGTTQRRISGIENGWISPTADTIEALARGLGISAYKLFKEDGSRSAL